MSARFHSRWMDLVPKTARNRTDKTDKSPPGAPSVSFVSSSFGRFDGTDPPTEETPQGCPAGETVQLSGFLAPATCPRCGEPTAPLMLIRSDGSRAVLCPQGHWTPAGAA